MEDVKTFRTKTGYCHITPDQIILNKDAVLDTSEKMTESDGVVKIVLVYIIFAAYLIYSAYGDFGRGENVMAGILALVAVGLIYAIAISLDNSGTPVIDRSSIKKVTFTTGRKGLSRSVFVDVINAPETEENKEKYASWLKLSREVNQVLKALRDDAGIVFEADTEK